ncbi:hypothetical protein AB0875_29540 [Micromonospora gifhornensis]|uniref:hypothetical protein n=1 Tax=Micromonospora gifhornensis TaxID=84594 RepID=UPI0034519FE8
MSEALASGAVDDRDFVRDTLREDYMLTRQQQRDLLNTFERNLAVLIAGLSLAVAFGKDVVVIILPFALTVIAAYQLHQLGDMQMLAARRHCLQLRIKELLASASTDDTRALPDDANVGDSRSYSIGHLMLVALGGAFAISATLSIVTAFRVWHWAFAAGSALLIFAAGWFLVVAACEMLLALSNTYASYSSKGWTTPSTAKQSPRLEALVRTTLGILLFRRWLTERPDRVALVKPENPLQRKEKSLPDGDRHG